MIDLSGNDVSGNVVSRNDVSGNVVSRNDVSGNDVSRNDVSGNDVSGNKFYIDKDRKLYNKCNTTVNSKEYYTDSGDALSAFGGALSIPFIISSLLCSCIITSLLTVLAYTFYSGSKKMTSKVVITITCCIMFLLSTIYNIINYYKATHKIKKLTNNPNARPCYSESKKQIIS